MCLTLSWWRQICGANPWTGFYIITISIMKGLKQFFENGWLFCNITELGWFWKQLSRKKALYNPFLKSLQYQSYAVKCSSKWVFLEISQYSQENICAEAPLINLQALRPLYLKETPTQVFSCEYCKTFTNTNRFFTEHLRWLLLSFW